MSGWWLLAGIVLFIIGSFASAWALAKVLNRQKPRTTTRTGDEKHITQPGPPEN